MSTKEFNSAILTARKQSVGLCPLIPCPRALDPPYVEFPKKLLGGLPAIPMNADGDLAGELIDGPDVQGQSLINAEGTADLRLYSLILWEQTEGCCLL